MPLLDHFHLPLSESRHWESFHALWAAALAYYLNENVLPDEYFAEVQVHIGGRVEVDVASFRQAGSATPPPAGGTTTLTKTAWTPAVAAMVLPAVFPDEIEVQVFSSATGPTLVAAVELVSPGNKDREEARRAFSSKCASYLSQGIGVVVVDVVTSRQANLHNELVQRMGLGSPFLLGSDYLLSAVGYGPVRREDADQIDVWPHALAVGQALPIVPLALRNDVCLPLDLESTYAEARRRSRLD